MSTNRALTIIIPFLNEKEEVGNTLESIRTSVQDNVTIILINDASDDGFNYESIAKDYNACYIHNKARIGVAASRNLGVEQSNTPYIMFLDAHMRFYDSLWLDRILNELYKEPNVLLCCQTKGITIIDEQIVENKKRPVSFGACIDFYNERDFLEPRWLFKEEDSSSSLNTIDIPCVLGAAYACRKHYWKHLKGLEGLMYYGNDESYISIKVWLEGGRCKLLKDVIVGHIYRDTPPYLIENTPRLYNRLLLAELLLPDCHKARLISYSKYFYKKAHKDALLIIYQKRKKLFHLKRYYNNIFKYDFHYYERINNKFNSFTDIMPDKNELLQNIAIHLVLNTNSLNEIGVINGKLGIVLFLFHYAKYSNNKTYQDFAEKILEKSLDDLNINSSIGFSNGLSGIGWTVEYLYQNKFIKGDINEILEDLDKKISEVDINTIEKLDFDNGLAGIIHYILARLYTINKEYLYNPFTTGYLSKLYDKALKVISNNKNLDCIDAFVNYSMYYEGYTAIQQPSVYDIVYISIPSNYQIDQYVLGLHGNAGIGIALILEDFKSANN